MYFPDMRVIFQSSKDEVKGKANAYRYNFKERCDWTIKCLNIMT